METDSDSQQIFLSEEETSASSSIEPEFNDKKRKRSVTESSDTESSICSKGKISNKSESIIVPNLNLDNSKLPLLLNPSCSKNLEIPMNLASLDVIEDIVSNKTSPEDIKHVDRSTNVVTSQNITAIPAEVSNVATSSTVPFKDTNNSATAQIIQKSSVSIPHCIGSTLKNKVNMLPSQVKTAVVGPRRISVTMTPNIAQATTSKIEPAQSQNLQTNSDKDIKIIPVTNSISKIEIEKLENASVSKPLINRIAHVVPTGVNTTEHQTILDINARVTIVTSASSNSSGPGPPCVTASPTTLTCKTVTPIKSNSHPKMIPFNSKAISIDAKSNVDFAGKRKLIVFPKGMKRVMLSHRGKEARGKVISSVPLVPCVPPNNGDKSDSECAKLINMAGSKMVVLDIRQDVLEKNIIFPQRLEIPSVMDIEPKATPLIPTNNILNEPSNNRSSSVEKELQLSNSTMVRLVNNENEESHKMSPRNIFEDADLKAMIEKASDKEPLFLYNDKETIVEGTLDPQTGVFEIQSSDDAIKNVQCEETLLCEEFGQFSSTLETEIINSESSQCTEDTNTSFLSEEANSPILNTKKLDINS